MAACKADTSRMFCFAQQYSRKVNYVIVNNKEKKNPNFCIRAEACSAHNTIVNGTSSYIFV